MSYYNMCAWCPQRSEDAVGCTGTGVFCCCELQCDCWKLNLGSLKERQVLLTSKPPFGPFYLSMNKVLKFNTEGWTNRLIIRSTCGSCREPRSGVLKPYSDSSSLTPVPRDQSFFSDFLVDMLFTDKHVAMHRLKIKS